MISKDCIILIGVLGIMTLSVFLFLMWFCSRPRSPTKTGKRVQESENEHKPTVSVAHFLDNELVVTRIGALLDFYSDKAVAHASFFVASIFGLVTLWSIVQQLNMHLTWFSIPLFFAFSYVGYYTLGRFTFYADISQKLGEHGLKYEETLQGVPYKPKNKPKTTLKDYIDKQEDLQKNLFILKKIIAKGRGKYYLALLYWVLIGFLGSIVYSRFLCSFIGWFVTFSMVIVSVIIPGLYYYKMSRKARKE